MYCMLYQNNLCALIFLQPSLIKIKIKHVTKMKSSGQLTL
jgi:hypothetical protein